jgi:hypothetical protein
MTATQNKHWLGIIGTIFGCLAIVAAVLPTWVLPVVLPPEPVDKVVVDTAQKIKDRVAARVKGVEFKEPERSLDWYKILAIAAVSLGVLALIFGAVSFVAHEPWRYAGAAATLGAGAIVFQFSLLVAGALLGIFCYLSSLARLTSAYEHPNSTRHTDAPYERRRGA